jgi:simple sugar transport system permease protein
MYAIGGNPEAARLSGIRTTRYKVAAYVIASLLAGWAAFCWPRALARRR